MKLMAAYSCLVAEEIVEKLGKNIEKINKREGFAVRFKGSGALFSFIDLKGKIEDFEDLDKNTRS